MARENVAAVEEVEGSNVALHRTPLQSPLDSYRSVQQWNSQRQRISAKVMQEQMR
jgi:hypothetical protein